MSTLHISAQSRARVLCLKLVSFSVESYRKIEVQ